MSVKNFIHQRVVGNIGTGNIVLGNAVPGYTTYTSQFANGEEVYYTLQEGTKRESGFGKYYQSTNFVSRDFVFETINDAGVHSTANVKQTFTSAATVALNTTSQSITEHADVYKILPVPLLTQTGTIDVPPFVNYSGSKVAYGFSPTLTKGISFSCPLPTDAKRGSDFEFLVHWAGSDSNLGNVVWEAQYTHFNIGSGYVEYVISSTEPSGGDKILVETAIQGTQGIHRPGNSIINGILIRKGGASADTYTSDALLLGLSIRYLSDRVGAPQKTGSLSWG